MRKLFLIVVVTMMVSYTQAQNTNIPSGVTKSFQRDYPSISEANWEKKGNNYQVSYKENNMEHIILYDEEGTAIKTQDYIDVSTLPQAVMDYTSKNIPGKEISRASRIKDQTGKTSYGVQVGNTEYMFDESGKYMSKNDMR